METRKDSTALVIGAMPPNLKLHPCNRNPLPLFRFFFIMDLQAANLTAAYKGGKFIEGYNAITRHGKTARSPKMEQQRKYLMQLYERAGIFGNDPKEPGNHPPICH